MYGVKHRSNQVLESFLTNTLTAHGVALFRKRKWGGIRTYYFIIFYYYFLFKRRIIFKHLKNFLIEIDRNLPTLRYCLPIAIISLHTIML